MLDFVNGGPDNLDQVLSSIESAWQARGQDGEPP
jgi:hypothetical protein